jgi:drug/metabolite transporter (DMT)-like permease
MGAARLPLSCATDAHASATAMNPGRGITLKVASTFVFTLMLVCVKAVSGRIPPGEVVFARSFFALIPIAVMLVWQGQIITAIRTERPWRHVTRGVVGLLAMSAGFISLRYLPLPEQMAIGYAAPIFVVALAAIILGETVRIYRWSAVAIGFIGVVVILWPRFTLFVGGYSQGTAFLGAIIALFGAFCGAGAAIAVRSMTRTETTASIVLYFALSASVMSLVVSLPLGWVVPSPSEAVLLVSVGLLGGVGQILMTAAYRYADAATVATFDYASMLWGVAFGYLLFSEVPTRSVILGGSIVVAAGIFIIWRERRLGMQRKRQRKATPAAPV